MVGCMNSFEELRRRPDHQKNTHNLSPKLLLQIGKDEDEDDAVVDFHVH